VGPLLPPASAIPRGRHLALAALQAAEVDRRVLMNSTMRALKAHGRGGRLLLDEPTDLPNDEVLASGGDYLDVEDRERLHASIDRGLEDVLAGRTTDARQVMATLRARASGR
jgi:hypothetical protein